MQVTVPTFRSLATSLGYATPSLGMTPSHVPKGNTKQNNDAQSAQCLSPFSSAFNFTTCMWTSVDTLTVSSGFLNKSACRVGTARCNKCRIGSWSALSRSPHLVISSLAPTMTSGMTKSSPSPGMTSSRARSRGVNTQGMPRGIDMDPGKHQKITSAPNHRSSPSFGDAESSVLPRRRTGEEGGDDRPSFKA